MSSRPLLSADARTPEAATAATKFHGDIVTEVAETIANEPVVIVGMAVNPFVKKARKALEEAGIAFRYLEYGSYLKGWHKRLAIKMWSGWPTFPQVYVRGTLVGGFQETTRALENGSLQQLLQASDKAA
ncbi:MAG: glutaredoxin domain-containing protein [Nannocystaceae bacterium]